MRRWPVLALICAFVLLSSVLLLDVDRRHAVLGDVTDRLRALLATELSPDRPGAWAPSPHAVTLAVAAFVSPPIEARCRVSALHCERAKLDERSSSLRSEAEWLRLLGRLTRHVRWPMVIATTPDFAPAVRALRPTGLLVLEYASAAELPPIVTLGGKAWADEQAAFVTFDHGWSAWPPVYAVWAAKAWLVAEAARLNPWHSRLFFWVDAGALQERHPAMLFHPLPDLALLATRADAILAEGRPDQIIMSAAAHPHAPAATTPRVDWGDVWVQGLLFGGNAEAVDRYAQLYQATLEQQKAGRASAAREEALMTWLARRLPINLLLAADAVGCRASSMRPTKLTPQRPSAFGRGTARSITSRSPPARSCSLAWRANDLSRWRCPNCVSLPFCALESPRNTSWRHARG